MPDGSFLNRYWDDLDTPRLESYKEDVETAIKAEEAAIALGGLTKELFSRKKVCRNLRASGATGWDHSSRYLKDGKTLESINTTDIAPIDLNSLMAYHAETLAIAYEALADTQTDRDEKRASLERAAFFQQLYDDRLKAINTYLWDPNDKIYRDYNFVEGAPTKIVSAAMVYPLYVGIANAEQAFGVMRAIERDLLYPGGIIATTTEESNEQWDGGTKKGTRSKNVWAPFNWAAMRGFARMAHCLRVHEGLSAEEVEPLLAMAEKIQQAYLHGIEEVFGAHHVITEKHRGDNPAKLATGGEYALVKLLAMSLETYVAMKARDVRNAEEYTALGSLAVRRALRYRGASGGVALGQR
jgi:neutral trehalase